MICFGYKDRCFWFKDKGKDSCLSFCFCIVLKMSVFPVGITVLFPEKFWIDYATFEIQVKADAEKHKSRQYQKTNYYGNFIFCSIGLVWDKIPGLVEKTLSTKTRTGTMETATGTLDLCIIISHRNRIRNYKRSGV